MMHHISSKTENMSDFLQSIFSKQTLIPGDAEVLFSQHCAYFCDFHDFTFCLSNRKL